MDSKLRVASRLYKHVPNRLATVHGLDFGIHAEMTAFWALLKQLANQEGFISFVGRATAPS